ncbi:unnamed protein product [Enterobius vermicularis]|uniref:Mitochondrial import inner membrane translocase subunit tim-16 n=1 Tax=Enterobius vermicularis TaxID=51028 RepID=A0A0N4V4C2_ENTVE|nr:unnamed protein product [Enterobius vermicularis]
MVWRNAARLLGAVAASVARAFGRAVREEINMSKQAAARATEQSGRPASETRKAGETNARLGITLQEAMQILNVKQPLNAEEIEENYKRLFEINDKSKGGSLYLQSKVYRAKERIDEELFKEPDSSKEASTLKKDEEDGTKQA